VADQPIADACGLPAIAAAADGALRKQQRLRGLIGESRLHLHRPSRGAWRCLTHRHVAAHVHDGDRPARLTQRLQCGVGGHALGEPAKVHSHARRVQREGTVCGVP